MSKKHKQSKMIVNPVSGIARSHYQSSGKEVRTKENPGSTDHQTPAWQFHLRDMDHEYWGWEKLSSEEIIGLISKHLPNFEKMTWSQIKQAAGGRSSGTNSHPLSIDGFVTDAKKRLHELKVDDIDELFSLRLNNTLRLYGIRDGRVLRFIWHDPHHGSKNGAYPTKNVK